MDIAMDQVVEFAQMWGLKAVAALTIFIVGRIAAKILRNTLRKALHRINVDEMLVSFASNIAYVLLLIVVIIAALNQLGVQTTSFIAILGAAGLAVGLALQGSLANFAAGVMIIIFRPFHVGDFIDAGGSTGTVEEIEIFTTKMKTPDNKLIIIPNSQITSGSITNFSAKDTRRIDLVIGVSYSDDLGKVKSVLESILNDDQRILKDPAPTIGVLALADSSINFAVRPWVKSADYWTTLFDLNKIIKERFDQEGISIPFPQQDVHLHQIKHPVAA
ncbi:mechanosensitive ion channel family protein [Desulfonatronovibrio hydrogenovorans]|uniref:mechanosensitive ion channel family protein n=1 Tax=Desulfonatronovibrio hydrogenovorans TaxID=53245 RepID=UPI00048D3CAC|nr:mechanosensitive ion channel domain-containing protein [Desulfonatronovibrio hydrogenovorans]